MLQVVVCGKTLLQGIDALEGIIEESAREAGLDGARILTANGSIELFDLQEHPKGEPVDLVLLAHDLTGMSGLQAIRDIRHAESTVRILLFSDDTESALEAAGLDVSGFLPADAPAEQLAQVLARLLPRIAHFHRHSVTLKLRDRTRRILRSRVLYAETRGHNQVIHLTGGVEYDVRSTSQALFDQLESSGRFFKAGSSYIINLRQVERVSSDTGRVILSDGSAIAVPVRLRKTFEQALMNPGR